MFNSNLRKAALYFVFTLIGSNILVAQKGDSLLQKRIQFRQYVFEAQAISTQQGNIQLQGSVFKVRVTYDSIIAILPFYGNSYSPQFGRSEDDIINFVSTNFEYTDVAKKKGKWEITMEPKDAKGIRIFLTVFNNGDAQMEAINPRKQTMLYKGYVW